MIAFFLKSWGKWLLTGLAVAGLIWAVDHYRSKAELATSKVETVTTELKATQEREDRLIVERKVLVDNQKAWSAALVKIDNLARESVTARAAESQRITDIAASLATAKEGIKHAPGADDSFAFSDAAYGLVRSKAGAPASGPGGSGASPAQGTAGVGAR